MALRLRKDNGRLLPDRSLFKATSINHLAYGAIDYAKTRDWFMDLFGMIITYDDGKRCSIAWGNPCHELYIGPRQPTAVQINHWAIGVTDFLSGEFAKGKLDAYNVPNVRYDGDWAWHTDDPDKIVLQVCAEVGCFPGAGPGNPRPEAWLPPADNLTRPQKTDWVATALNHISYRVPDYRKTRDWYMDLLGMKLVFEDDQQCALAFGDPENGLWISQGQGPLFTEIGISLENFDLAKVEGDIKKLGLKYEVAGDAAITIYDPDGFPVQVCAEKGNYPGAKDDTFHRLKK